MTKQIIGFIGQEGELPLTYMDINGRRLELPSFVFPFRRALYFVAKTAYERAMNSTRRRHECATASCPSEEKWSQFVYTVRDASEGFAYSSVGTLVESEI